MSKTRLSARAGFTLTEVMVVIVILAIIAAVAIPAMIGFIRYGQHVNRMNVARTLYVSMQNQLSRAMVEGNLRSVLTEDFYVDDTTETIAGGRVANELGADFPDDDEANIENVYFISKPAGYTPGGAGSNDVLDKFYGLLDEIIINKDILYDAILMEFNVRTGVIMSIFYGDELNLWFQSGPGSGNNRSFGYGAPGFDDVSGSRGMENDIGIDTPYPAYGRRQGYFGVLSTGNPADIQLPDFVNLFDGTVKALEYRENVLYAELYIPKNTDAASYTLELVTDDRDPFGFEAITGVILPDGETTTLNYNIFGYDPYLGGELVYLYKKDLERGSVEEHGIRLDGNYDLYIWVLDCVYNDLTQSQKLSIDRYKVFNTGAADPQLVRAKLTREDGVNEGAGAVSVRTDHSHYGGDFRNSYEVKSARHLNNIRYFPGGGFRQTETIDMAADLLGGNQDAPGAVTNFAPIRNFTGTYDAIDQTVSGLGGVSSSVPSRIRNLNIDVPGNLPDQQNVGLFAEISRSGGGGRVNGVSLFEAKVKSQGAANVGAIAGELKDGGMIMRCNSYADVTGGSGSTGGIVGRITDGTLTHSFNAGFYDTHTGTTADSGVGSVLADGGNIGGLAGTNGGVIQFCFNNARVNIEDVELTEDDWLLSIQKEPPENNAISTAAYLGGIAGNNTGTISRSYATNFVAQYENGDRGYSGGIAGTNPGGVISSDSRYITNGCPDVGNDPGGTSRAISKLDLMEENLTAAPASLVTFKPEETNVADYLDETDEDLFPKNVYERYPYPLLSNNMPFVDSPEDWGWEDIEDEVEIPEVRLVYYEYYDNNGTSRGYYNSFDTTLANQLQTTPTTLVHHDGYAIEFSPIHSGYRIMFNEDVYLLQGDENDVWRLYEEDEEDEYEPLEDWLPAREFTATIDGELTDLYRLYIPNEFAEELVSDEASVDLQFFAGRDEEPLENIPDSTYSYFPLFARNTPPNAGTVRSPRHIENIRKALGGEYTQSLNVDFGIYHREIMLSGSNYVVDPATKTLDEYQAAVVTGTFTGRYDGYSGTAWWIANLNITGTSNNAGLFAQNSGTIRYVTLRSPNVAGGSNVGAIAGTNSGTITNCSVQHAVPQAGTPPPYLSARPIVSGGTNIGGIAGNNTGTLTNVTVVSTSGTPAVRGTTYVGGIAGITTNTSTVDHIMYLAVAPRTGTGLQVRMHPYVGSGYEYIGGNRYYLSGTNAIRPFRVSLPPDIMTNYNINNAENLPGAHNTLNMVRQFSNNGAWSVQTLTDAAVTSQTNATFPYPYPSGTVMPVALDWPLVDSLVLAPRDAFVYYEKYADGTAGVFTRRLLDVNNSDSGYIILDFLNPNGEIVESGYAVYLDSNRTQGNFQMPVGFFSSVTNNWNNAGSWTYTNINAGSVRSGTSIHADYPDLYSIPYSWLTPNVSSNSSYTDPTKPVAIVMASGNGNNAVIAGAYLVNPLFAKDLYPVVFTGHTHNRTITPPVMQLDTHIIRTPWHMQQISKINARGLSAGNTFIQESNLDFSSVTLTGTVRLNNVTGNGVTTRNAGWVVNYSASAEQNNGTTAVITTTTANIVANTYTGVTGNGPFNGIYDGSERTISNLRIPMQGTTNNTNNKGLFNTIGASGRVRNFTMINSVISGGENNAGVASVNNGLIENVDFVSTSGTAPVSAANAANAGGIVWTNNGSISNTLYLARAPMDSTGTGRPISALNNGEINTTYYLSGIFSSNNRPSVNAAPGDFNSGAVTGGGTARTTQELNSFTALAFGSPWRASPVPETVNTMTVTQNPNPYIGSASTPAWPVATIPAQRLAYFERYEGGGMGFYTPTADGLNAGLPPLRDNGDADSAILSTGYCAIVPRQGGYSIKPGAAGSNTHIESASIQYGGNTYHYVSLPSTITSGNTPAAVEVYVNDLQVADANSRFANTLFAKGIYATATPAEFFIRTPQQMRNISNVPTSGMAFTQERDLDFTSITRLTAAGVVTGTFSGTYDGGGNMISNLMINSTAASVGLFSHNGDTGNISNLTLFFDNSVPLPAGSADIAGADLVGAIAGTNTGTISDITVVSTRVADLDAEITSGVVPVGSTNSNAGGIAGQNSGTIERVLYLARAPEDSTGTGRPISAQNSGDISRAYYLSGTVSSNNRPSAPAVPGNFNSGAITGGGTARTTQELNSFTGLAFGSLWGAPLVPGTANTITGTQNPYPLIGPAPTPTWPVATIPAQRLAYFERYEGGGMGFFTPAAGNAGLPPLRDNGDTGSTILSTGYCAIVPGQGGYSLKVSESGQNTHIQALTYGAVNYVVIPETMISGNVTVQVYVNDLEVTDTGRFINTMFAKGIFTNSEQKIGDTQELQELYIRIPQHMRNVNAYASAGRDFIQERDLDFTGIDLNTAGAVVGGTFDGTYDGGGNMISNLMISNTAADASVGMFSKNEGTISRLTLLFNNSVSLPAGIAADITGAGFVGTIAGTNSGTIIDITIVSSRFTGTGGVDAQAVVPVRSTGSSAGGIVGQNSGTIGRVLYLAQAPAAGGLIYPVVGEDAAGSSYNEVHYLSGSTHPAAIIGSAGTVTELVGSYDYTDSAYVAGTPGNTAMLGALTLPGWVSPGSGGFVYPYPNIDRTPPGLPPQWPVVDVDPLPDPGAFVPGMAELEGFETTVAQDDIAGAESAGAGSAGAGSAGAGKTKQDDPISEESGYDIEKESKKLENLLVVASAITLFGGYNIVNKRTFKARTQPLRAFMRRSNARAVRRINEHNQRTRGEP